MSLIFEIDKEFTEIFKIKDKAQFEKKNSKDHPLGNPRLGKEKECNSIKNGFKVFEWGFKTSDLEFGE